MNGEDNRPDQQGGNWRYTAHDDAPVSHSDRQVPPPHAASGVQDVTWTASEFIARQKGFGWYALLILGAVVVIGLVYLLSRDFITVGAIAAAIILFGVAAGRKPRVLTYHMNDRGLAIGEKFYPYSSFKSFSVMDEDAFSSIMLFPLKRFMPPINLYYEPQDEDRIITLLAGHLPMENRSTDAVDRLMKHIRF